MGSGWQVIARFILRRRIFFLVLIALATIFMWINRGTERDHAFGKVIPADDPEYIDYLNFKKEFGEDGNVLIVGLEGDLFDLDFFNGIYDLTDSLSRISGIKNVISITKLFEIVKVPEEEKFNMQAIPDHRPESQAEMDSLRDRILNLPFYQGLIINDNKNATLLGVAIEPKRLDSEEKVKIADAIIDCAEYYAAKIDAETRYAGLPYIRVYTVKNLPREMILFLSIALVLTAITLFMFFRSFQAVFVPLSVIGIVVIWALGIIGLLGYTITIMTSIVPTLITVIGIPNGIYLITKYHFEFKKTKNKIKSLILVIEKIGIVTVMTNATTAVGFLVLYFTNIPMLKEFGVVAGLSVVTTFFISLILIPIIFSFLPPPGPSQTKHTENKALKWVINGLDYMVHKKRSVIYVISIALLASGIFGLTKLEAVSHMVDDIPKEDKIYADLKFMEENFKGVMPFEIVIDTKRRQGLQKLRNLKKIDKLQKRIAEIPEISKTISVVDMIKFARQAFYNGGSKEYVLPDRDELNFIMLYTKKSTGMDGNNLLATIVDSTYSKTRIKGNIKDIGSIRMKEIIAQIQTEIDSLFLTNVESGDLKIGETYKLFGDEDYVLEYSGKEYGSGERIAVEKDTTYAVLAGSGKIDIADKTKITGTTKIFIKGNDYLIKNLIQSMILAFIVIAFLMAILFGSLKMVMISMIPNILPILLTAGIMGFFGIPLKPSTALIFSVAFGISVDDTIHYLARFRLARKSGDSIAQAVSNSFKDTGVSMIYTSIILFFGFVIFSFSSFGGTEALGKLTSLTLGIALFTNLLLLPALLLSLNKDTEQLAHGFIDYEEEKENVEAMKEIYSSENGEDLQQDIEKKLP